MTELNEIEQVVRTRLRSLRNTLGLSLDDLAARANLSASTISRVETGKRTISLDVLLPLASALHVDLDSLLDVHSDDDVVIRPVPSSSDGRTTWMLSRPTGNTIAIKMRLEPTDRMPEQRVHPGHDWFFVVEGRVRLQLGDREVIVETGEAAEFATMTPHATAALDGPAEIIMIFDRDGQRAHVHHDNDAAQKEPAQKEPAQKSLHSESVALTDPAENLPDESDRCCPARVAVSVPKPVPDSPARKESISPPNTSFRRRTSWKYSTGQRRPAARESHTTGSHCWSLLKLQRSISSWQR